MLLGSAFVSYLISHLFFNGFFVSALLLVGLFSFSVFLIFKYKILNQGNKQNKRLLRPYIVLSVGFCIGLLYTIYLNYSYGDVSGLEAAKNIKTAKHGTVIQLSKKSAILEFQEAQKKYRIRIFAQIDDLNLSKGSEVTFLCKRLFSDREDTFSLVQRLQKISQSCRGVLFKEEKYVYSMFESFRLSVKEFLKKRLEQFPENTLAAGFILADTADIPPVEMHFFRKMGIAHLFAASGLHMGLLFLICYLPFVWLRIPTYGEIFGLILCTLFLVLLDFPTSLLRAYFFLSIFLYLKFLDRKTPPFYIFFFTACVSEIIFPLSAFSYSFILSFGVTGAILLCFPFFRNVLSIRWPYLRDHLALTLSAFTGSAFLSYILFGYINILSVLYNFLLVPLSGIYLFLALMGILFLPVSKLLFFIDQIFHFSVYLHQTIWERFFTSTSGWGINIWLGFFGIFFLTASFLMITNKKWYIRKNFLKGAAVLVVIYFIQFFFIAIPASGFKAFPYGVILYENKNLYLFGEVASFIKEGQEKFFRRPDVPIDQIYISSKELKTYAEKVISVPYEKTHKIDYIRKWNLLKFQKKCFIFMGRRFSFQKTYQNTKKCSAIYLVASRKNKENLKINYEKFQGLQSNISVFMTTFNKWNWYE